MTNVEVSRQRFLGLPREHLIRLLCMTTAVPALFVAVDTVVIGNMKAHQSFISNAILWAVLIAQIAILGLAAARFLDHAAWRWIVFGWGIVLIDLLVFAIGGDAYWSSGVSALMISGQVGLLVIWGLLGDMYWAWRFPVLAVAVAVSGILTLGYTNSHGFDASWLWCQNVAMFLLVGVLWLFRYRMEQSAIDGYRLPITHERPQNERLQFSILHLFAWMTFVALVFAVLRLIDWGVVFYLGVVFGVHAVLHELSVATLTSLVALVGLWGALGEGRRGIRYAVLIMAVPLLGLVVGLVYEFTAPWNRWSIFRQRGLGGLGWQWFWQYSDVGPWMTRIILSTFFLTATLLILRASGYRLYRRAKAIRVTR